MHLNSFFLLCGASQCVHKSMNKLLFHRCITKLIHNAHPLGCQILCKLIWITEKMRKSFLWKKRHLHLSTRWKNSGGKKASNVRVLAPLSKNCASWREDIHFNSICKNRSAHFNQKMIYPFWHHTTGQFLNSGIGWHAKPSTNFQLNQKLMQV